tara:strand:+ start:45 stop:779 length:735 start_codon:yes stop_codon:yes gene_type:complete
MNIIKKIKYYINRYRRKKSYTNRFKLFTVKIASFFTESKKCTRCNGEGYIEIWKKYHSLNPKFKEYNKPSAGVCFICRGGGIIWKIVHIVGSDETLGSICETYNLVNDRNHQPKINFVLSWNPKIPKIGKERIKKGDKMHLWIDFHILAKYKSNMIPTRIKNGYFQIKSNINSGWEWFHRNIVENIFGYIPKGFEVHHIDHNKLNNHPDNLVPLPRDLHRQYHRLVHKSLVKRQEIVSNVKENK